MALACVPRTCWMALCKEALSKMVASVLFHKQITWVMLMECDVNVVLQARSGASTISWVGAEWLAMEPPLLSPVLELAMV